MKVLIVIVLVGIICTYCSSDTNSTSEKKDDSIELSYAKLIPVRDTIIEYSIEGISAEGATVKAKYFRGKIVECAIHIFGETGQIRIKYTFQDRRINVVEKQYTYKDGILNIKTDEDLKLNKEISYIVDANGIPVGKVDSDRTDIFTEFKKAVPLEIK